MRQEQVNIDYDSEYQLGKAVLLSFAKDCCTASVSSVNYSCFKSRMYCHLNTNLELRPKNGKFVKIHEIITLGMSKHRQHFPCNSNS